jgi:hypothetical protein
LPDQFFATTDQVGPAAQAARGRGSERAKWTTGGYGAGTRMIKATSSRKTSANRLSVLSSMLHTAAEWNVIPCVPCRFPVLSHP